MSLHLFRILFRDGRVLALCTALAAFTGCHKEEIASYEAPKDQPLPASGSPHAGHGAPDASQNPMAGAPRPGLRWRTLPEGWTSNGPSGMRVATFTIASSSGATADLGVIPLPGTGGSDLDLVNLWRSQLSLPPITEPELSSHTDETSVGGQTVKLFTIVGSGSSDATAAANQILVAALRREGSTWFFKLGGPADIVAANREALKSFLGSVEFTAPEASESPHAATAAAAPVAESSSGPNAAWEIPESWKSVPAPRMVHSKWTTTSEKGGTADVTVSVFPGEAGGLLPNLNRWRSQVGLGPAPDTELNPLVGNLEISGGQGTLVDFQGQSPESGAAMRLVGAVVKKDGNSWYYKILGTPTAVEAQRAAFVKFIQTARYTRG